MFGMPVICESGSWRYVDNLPMNENVKKRIETSVSRKSVEGIVDG